ncbi:ribosome biogenesis GTP-binding protein YihA/YsxC [Buchnera aphidicola]|uniref:ribosome biogenesis GTP-binding protein YihA/YsxC n=1 Tax=Buchnera aphidicola TaxID=9 RepID=UPI0031B6CCD2
MIVCIKYENTKFLKSALKSNDWVSPIGSEIAFLGYSNVGKSRALNVLTKQKKLTRVSKRPGRTQLINFFQVSSIFRLVDFPGYGYSKINLKLKNKISTWAYQYLQTRICLHGIVLFSDIRSTLKFLDEKILLIAKNRKIPVLILLTKSDKLSLFKKQKKKKNIKKKLLSWGLNYKINYFSSLTCEGLEIFKNTLENWLKKKT